MPKIDLQRNVLSALESVPLVNMRQYVQISFCFLANWLRFVTTAILFVLATSWMLISEVWMADSQRGLVKSTRDTVSSQIAYWGSLRQQGSYKLHLWLPYILISNTTLDTSYRYNTELLHGSRASLSSLWTYPWLNWIHHGVVTVPSHMVTVVKYVCGLP